MTQNVLEPPSARYRAALVAHDYSPDAAQERAMQSLDRVWRELNERGRPPLLARLKSRFADAAPELVPVRGLYMWGGVGRGKTFLMDQFFHALPFDEKLRLHFHRFMQGIHNELKTLSDAEDPLKIVASRIAQRARVICFDEFFVSDIADAMILGRLFEHLFRYGVTLVATSNIPPDDLYKDGLQRARFLPAIAAIRQHCEILNVDAGTDYRLRLLEGAELYRFPLGEAADAALEQYFENLSPEEQKRDSVLQVNGHFIPVLRESPGIAWFNFSSLCTGPRSASDYIEIAREYHTVFVSHTPALDTTRDNETRRFISMIDEFYDRRVKLIISAAVRMEDLYVGERLKFEFQRTLSRLREMQSANYLSLSHHP